MKKALVITGIMAATAILTAKGIDVTKTFGLKGLAVYSGALLFFGGFAYLLDRFPI